MRCDWCEHSGWDGEQGALKCGKKLHPKQNEKGVLYCNKYMRAIGVDDDREVAYNKSFKRYGLTADIEL